MVVSGIAAAIIVESQKIYKSQMMITDMQQNNRIALDMMTVSTVG